MGEARPMDHRASFEFQRRKRESLDARPLARDVPMTSLDLHPYSCDTASNVTVWNCGSASFDVSKNAGALAVEGGGSCGGLMNPCRFHPPEAQRAQRMLGAVVDSASLGTPGHRQPARPRRYRRGPPPSSRDSSTASARRTRRWRRGGFRRPSSVSSASRRTTRDCGQNVGTGLEACPSLVERNTA
jgi:hypothetical protein